MNFRSSTWVRKGEGRFYVDVAFEEFVVVGFGDDVAVYGCGCVGHGAA